MHNDDSMGFQQRKAEVLEEVHRAGSVYFDAIGPDRAAARLRYMRALERLTEAEIRPASKLSSGV